MSYFNLITININCFHEVIEFLGGGILPQGPENYPQFLRGYSSVTIFVKHTKGLTILCWTTINQLCINILEHMARFRQLDNAIKFGHFLNNLQPYKKWNQYLPSTCSLVNFSLTKEKRDQFIKMNLQAANCGHVSIFEIIKKQPKQSIMEIASSFWHELETNRMNCEGCKTRICLFQI